MRSTQEWIEAHVDYPHQDWCLMWPFFRDKNGRAVISTDGAYFAHTMMCQLIHGDPPSGEHGTAHSCGNGHLGCVNPWHLSWKTQADNLADCVKHGTQPKTFLGPRGHFSMAQVAEIKRQLETRTQLSIAHQYRVTESTISDIARGRYYSRPPKVNYWEPEEDAKLREAFSQGMNFSQIAEIVGRSFGATFSRSKRLGLKRRKVSQSNGVRNNG